jgi:DNA-directed RNA polymerase I, II, and III subunit RPABC4
LDLGDPSLSHVTTFGGLRQHIVEEANVDIKGDFALLVDGREVLNEETIEFGDDPLVVVMADRASEGAKLKVIVRQGRVDTELTVPEDCTIAGVRDLYLQQGKKEALQALSFRGQRLADETVRVERLAMDVDDGEDVVLAGRMEVHVRDPECDVQTQVDVYEFETLQELREKYLQASRRAFHQGAVFRFDGEELEETGATLHSLGVRQESSFEYSVPPYRIQIKDTDEQVDGELRELEIQDHFSVQAIKDEYSRQAEEGLVDGDVLIFNGERLDDVLREAFRIRLTQGSVVVVEREDTSSQSFFYLCADCGSDVKLKREDPVRCRECGHRILFKRRTDRAVQYLAR